MACHVNFISHESRHLGCSASRDAVVVDRKWGKNLGCRERVCAPQGSQESFFSPKPKGPYCVWPTGAVRTVVFWAVKPSPCSRLSSAFLFLTLHPSRGFRHLGHLWPSPGNSVTQEWPLVEEPVLESLLIVGGDQFPFCSPSPGWKQTAPQ